MSEVKVWYMTEEERLAYIKKHPIKPTKKLNGSSYVNVEWELTRRKKKRK